MRVRALIVSTTFALGTALAGCSSDDTSSDPSKSTLPPSAPSKVSAGLSGAKLDEALVAGPSKSTSKAIDIGTKPTKPRQVTIPGPEATGTWSKGGMRGLEPTNPTSGEFAMPRVSGTLLSKEGAVILAASMKEGVVARGPFAHIDTIKPGQRVWVSGGTTKIVRGYDVISAQTMSADKANALITRPAGTKRLAMVFPSGAYDAKAKTYPNRIVIIALETAR